ncbi:S-layer homology domain-containing protein [Paenibacillus sp. BC26]|uniref:S-layer homology domain-containing protein n=1 Tax=Paenibacillus sp. BC26 TaxID=1881032 RepID=UPI0008EB9519|nr:S-layer homology domain-containing protein [Paenibacillus sp. BC26]SFS72390.1 S-layer homology domain-containing protein [Paenibacillus sp. BC26]
MRKYNIATILLLAIFLLIVSPVNGVSDDRTKQADTLHQLGLFNGMDNGYQLEAAFTRAQGTAMLLRLAGEDGAAAKAKLKPAFTDVKSTHWAAASIAYAVNKGYVKGISSISFAPDRLMTGKEFLTLINRLLGYPDAVPATAAELSQKNGLLQTDVAERLTGASPFLRGDMVQVAYAALIAKPAGSKKTLLQTLVEDKGAISAVTAAASGLYTSPSKDTDDDFYTPEPGSDPIDSIEEAIRQKLDGK